MTDGAQGPEADDSRFAAGMQEIRASRGISQAELVKRLRAGGWDTVHQTTISRMEKGERAPRLGEARAIAKALNVQLDRLMLSEFESRLAGGLEHARKAVEEAKSAVTSATESMLEARDRLSAIVAEAEREGHVPTPITEHDGFFAPVLASSGAVADELALAKQTLEGDPEGAFRLGRLLYRSRASRGEGEAR